MFVRLVLAILIVGSVAQAAPDQQPSFVLTVNEPVGGKPAQAKTLTDAIRAREAELKPALLAKTKAHPASRLKLGVKLEVLADGGVKPTVSTFSYRDARGDLADDSIKTTTTDMLAKTKKVGRDLKGMTVEVTVAILQP